MKSDPERFRHMVNIRLNDAQREALKRVCARMRVTPSDLVRRIVARLDAETPNQGART